ncbi:MAG: DNA mismatch repair endonuclease MutL [Candidatus Omnitrophota bacterium]
MGKVKTLREDVYKKIAAGEVVERPLSVVKELVENSLDAGADSLRIELADGGKQLINVTDNGSGFDPDDIETAFKNHSTSKISELSDFNTLTTLGFRGEALPSILEVARIEIQSANTRDGRGVACVFENGALIDRRDTACSRGTTIVVKDLFYNFPVRRKFLKSDRTELTQILAFLEPVVLVHFDKSFELVHNRKTVFIYKKTESMTDRVYQVFGKDILHTLHEVEFSREAYRLKGLISNLNTGLSDKKHQYFFVNRRPVKERTLLAALNNTYQRFLEKNRSPVGILLLDIPPNEVDVNIHPMKLEIKFEDSNAVYRFLKHAIEQSFGVSESWEEDVPMSPFRASPSGGSPRFDSGLPQGERSSTPEAETRSSVRDSARNVGRSDALPPREAPEQIPLFPGEFLSEDDVSIIGQYMNSYILVEKGDALLIIDQHNAHERVNFDDLKHEYRSSAVTSISPLFPVIIALSPSEISGLDNRKMELLEKMGFRLEPLSGNAYDIKAFPQILGEKNIKEALLTVIHLNARTEEINFEDSILAEIACKSAIKVNHKLYPDQMKTIVKNLFKTSNPYFCPHKRPIIVEFSLEQIEKLLKRK